MDKVGIVLVSHSYDIVKGLKTLLNQVQPDVQIAIAGGDNGGIGTSAPAIMEAIESVYSEKGVVVLFDLGSALLNTEMAFEMLGEDRRIQIADAPLVEGAYAGVVEAGFGNSIEEVVEACENARHVKKINR
ncbi:dihydroxyacetone kinase phosphoryl donor subunit DhaM [Fervidibacillus halotolerans]|uniref:phosphoenolpyruvate--glycerone phosphotransferase n=1 Tax=Fervidibacillus halotolerans TaxID=2980027 RepID=A0A9E8RY38_9BACI|nr:dihydroxyacetone kinase phosphoryl donor subunit DhaM [Fervidibacillus halotolerans]WAA13410.1 dihydroxyacetone kinase phosphoryl donor subunit DhaM [Fervidibacillus halotolerans]